MNHTQLKAFDAVVREGSFSKAGLRLGLTQPAITIQVKSLERDYGTKLFARRGRGVIPTQMGEQLFQMTQRIFKMEEQVHLFLKNKSATVGQEKLKIGSDCQSVASGLVTRWLSQHPGSFLSFNQFSTDSGYRELFNSGIDVFITATPTQDSRLHVQALDEQKLMVLLPRHHSLSKQKTISIADLVNITNLIYDQGSIIQTIIDQELQSNDKIVQPTMQMGSRDAVCHAVAGGFGVGIVIGTEPIEDQRVVALEVTGIKQQLSGYIVTLKSMTEQKHVKAFLNSAGGNISGKSQTFSNANVVSMGSGQVERVKNAWRRDHTSSNLFQHHLQTVVVK
ncbi:MAG: LysR family transcriptional regulator [Alphaproteobacteria bacterium]|nr:LysR family transcriptional regulator [Alphaproteobacteria bacterium]